MTAIASNLADRLPQATQPWAELAEDWKQRLAPALVEGVTPQYFIQPETELELAIALTHAHKNAQSVLICGGGSKLAWGNPVSQADLVVSTARLDRLVENAAGDLTFTAEAGMTLAAAQKILKPHNLFLAIDPSYPDHATLGGIIATADTGSCRHRYGGIRDLLLGIRFVRADGQIAKAGGRVVKNVAGYDLMKLFTGSYGTLGLLTQVTLRTHPLPETVSGLILEGELGRLEQVALAIARSSLSPLSVDWLLSESMIRLGLRFGSIASSVAEQRQEIERMADPLGLQVMAQSAWPDLAHRSPLAKFGVLPVAAPALLEQIRQQMPGAIALLHGGSGLGKLYGSLEPLAQADDVIQNLRHHCVSNGGFFSLLAVPRTLAPSIERWGYGGNAIATMQHIRSRFDPKKNLNVGLFLVE